MYCKTLNLHISLVVTPIEALFLSLSLEFTGLYDGIKIFLVWRSYQKLLKKNGLPSEREPTIVCVLLPTAHQLAYSVVAFSGMSDVYECLSSLQLVLAAIGEKQAGCNSPRSCLMSSIDLATFCGIWSTVGSHLRSFRSVSL